MCGLRGCWRGGEVVCVKVRLLFGLPSGRVEECGASMVTAMCKKQQQMQCTVRLSCVTQPVYCNIT